MAIRVDISPGEFLDRLTILEIKSERIEDPAKLANVRAELAGLREAWQGSSYAAVDLAAEHADLRRINELLWVTEDRIREKEALGRFDAEFVELARAVYRTNDERAAVKRRVNSRLGSTLVEEKQHPAYPLPAGSTAPKH